MKILHYQNSGNLYSSVLQGERFHLPFFARINCNSIYRKSDMFAQKSENRISAVMLCVMLGLWMFLVFSQSVAAQENVTVSKENLSEGIAIEMSGGDLSGGENFLVISDSAKHDLALLRVSLDGTQLWMKKSAEAVEFPNVVHWSEDEDSGALTIDLGGVRERISAQSTLQVVVVPFVSGETQLFLSLSQADDSGSLQKIKDVNVEINTEGQL